MKPMKVLYSMLKSVKEGKNTNAESLGITDDEFVAVVEYAMKQNYLKDVFISRSGRGNKVHAISVNDSSVTFEGEVFLDENSSLND